MYIYVQLEKKRKIQSTFQELYSHLEFSFKVVLFRLYSIMISFDNLIKNNDVSRVIVDIL